jgi:palmitoyltransferase
MIDDDNISDKDRIFQIIDSNKDGRLSDYLRSKINNNKYLPIWEYFDDSKNSILSRIINNNLINDFNYVFEYIKINIKDQKKFSDYINNKNNEGYSSIFFASSKGNIKIIATLIKNNANFRDKSNTGLNVLHIAAQNNQLKSLVYFKEKFNFDIESKDNSLCTPLHWACYLGSLNVVEFLLSWNANENSQDNKGNTPLHLAILSHNEKLIKRLLRKGANSKIKNKEGKTPLDLAKEKKNEKIIKIIEGKTICNCIYLKSPSKKIEKSVCLIIIFFIIYFVEIVGYLIILFPILNNFYSYAFISSIILVFLFYIILLCKKSSYNPIEYVNEKNLLKLVEKGEDIKEYCPKCLIKKKKFTVHCFICDVCIEDFDHHCSWINKCVGEKNYKFFNAFLVMNLINIILFFIFNIISFKKDYDSNCCKKITDKIKFLENIYKHNIIKNIYSGINIFICSIFGYIIITLLYNQIKNYFKNKNLYKKSIKNNNKNDYVIDIDDENKKRLLDDEDECNY